MKCFKILALVLLLPGRTGVAAESPPVSPQQGTVPPPGVVATVNGRPLAERVFNVFFNNGREELALDPRAPGTAGRIAQLRENILRDLTNRLLIVAEAEARGLAPTPERLEAAERSFISSLGGQEGYDKFLEENHVSREDYRDGILRGALCGEALTEALTKELSVSDEEVKAYYEAHRTEPAWQLPELARAAHLLISARSNLISQGLQERQPDLQGAELEKAVAEEMTRRRVRAETLREQALAPGADFAALVRAHSDDVGSRENDGDLGGLFRRGAHAQAIDDAVFSLPAGSLSPVVGTDSGFDLIKVQSREPARPLTLAEAAPRIRGAMLQARKAVQLRQWLQDAGSRAQIIVREADERTQVPTPLPPGGF